jgi:ABC-type antimicrobial peptide transport system permease subunit
MSVVVRSVSESGDRAEVYVASTSFKTSGAVSASQLKVFATNRSDVSDIRTQIESLGLTTSSPVDSLESVQQLFRILTIVLIGFGSIGIGVAMLGMFNTLTITLIERTKEIGLLVSMGARRRDIRRLVMVEGFVLALLGGVIGLGGAVALSTAGNMVIERVAKGRGATESISLFYTSPTLAIGALTLAGVIGVLVAAYPAHRAVRISPIRALRQE